MVVDWNLRNDGEFADPRVAAAQECRTLVAVVDPTFAGDIMNLGLDQQESAARLFAYVANQMTMAELGVLNGLTFEGPDGAGQLTLNIEVLVLATGDTALATIVIPIA